MDQVRNAVRSVMRLIARALNRLTFGKLSPNAVTYIGLLAHLPIAWLIAHDSFYWAGGLLIVFGLFDTLDGELARLQNRAGNKGMFLDSVTDRVKEVMLYIGAAYFFIQAGNPNLAIWTVAACGIAVIVSYLNAWGEVVTADLPKEHSKNKAFRNGIMTYDVRIFCLVAGLLSGYLGVAIMVIAVLSSVTALQRFSNVYRRL